jgi:heat shock protein HslJ
MSVARGILLVAAVSLLAAVAACGGTGTGSGGGDLDGTWRLVSGRDAGGSLPDLADRQVTLVVDGEQAGGVSACNHYGGRIEVDGETVSIGDLGGTEMGCEPDVMELEQRYLAALGAVERGERVDDELTLSGPDVALEYDLVPPEPDADLVGTTWLLESLVDGETASSTVPGGRLELTDDGTLTAETGCGEVAGTYRLEGDETVATLIDPEPGPPTPCDELAAAQHRHMVDVLADGFTWQVDGTRLLVTSPEGLGLEFRVG